MEAAYCKNLYMASVNDEVPYIVWLEDQDGGTVRCDAYDSVQELLKDWPHAVRIGSHEFEAWIGGGR
jgi:hypothetical protein